MKLIHSRHRGFATFTALALIAIVGTTFGVMTLNFASDARRTAKEEAGAQLRQLLIVGMEKARHGENGATSLPAALIEQGGEATISFDSSNAIARIDTKFRSNHSSIEMHGTETK